MLILSRNHGFNVIPNKKTGKNRDKFIPGFDEFPEKMRPKITTGLVPVES
jgi:hypothetical protein